VIYIISNIRSLKLLMPHLYRRNDCHHLAYSQSCSHICKRRRCWHRQSWWCHTHCLLPLDIHPRLQKLLSLAVEMYNLQSIGQGAIKLIKHSNFSPTFSISMHHPKPISILLFAYANITTW